MACGGDLPGGGRFTLAGSRFQRFTNPSRHLALTAGEPLLCALLYGRRELSAAGAGALACLVTRRRRVAGFMVHLTLDELYSVDLEGRSPQAVLSARPLKLGDGRRPDVRTG